MTLAARSITFGYRRGEPVLRDVSVTLPAGRVTALIGPNGAGKSTLLRLLLGARRAWAGSIELDGVELSELPAHRRAARIAFVPQRPSIAGPFSVSAMVELGRYAAGRDDGAVESSLLAMELGEHRDALVAELSVGQQQRAAVARALAQLGGPPEEPSDQLRGAALLADEPVAAMDPRHVTLTMSRFSSLARAGCAVGVVLHDLTLALDWADGVVMLDAHGRCAGQGPAGDVMTPERLEAIFETPFAMIGTGDQRAVVARRDGSEPNG